MRDITVFDALFIIKIVKELIKHRERMRSISNNLDWASLFVKIYILLIIIVKEKVSTLSPPQTPIQLALLADFFPHCWAWYLAKASKSWPYPWLANHGQNASFSSLRKQPTFGDTTTGFLAKWRLRDERRNTILMMLHYLDLGSETLIGRAMWEIWFNQSEPLPRSG